MNRRTIWALAVLMVLGGTVYGQEAPKPLKDGQTPSGEKATAPGTAPGSKLTPIEIRQRDTDGKAGQDYYQDGVKLESYQQLKAVIDPLGDPEASRLLKGSANRDSTGTVFVVGGGLLAVGGLIYSVTAAPVTTTAAGPFGPWTTIQQPDSTPSWVLTCIGGGAAVIGAVLKLVAEQDRKDAVKRYNQVVESGQDLSMILFPRTQSPGLEWTGRF